MGLKPLRDPRQFRRVERLTQIWWALRCRWFGSAVLSHFCFDARWGGHGVAAVGHRRSSTLPANFSSMAPGHRRDWTSSNNNACRWLSELAQWWERFGPTGLNSPITAPINSFGYGACFNAASP